MSNSDRIWSRLKTQHLFQVQITHSHHISVLVLKLNQHSNSQAQKAKPLSTTGLCKSKTWRVGWRQMPLQYFFTYEEFFFLATELKRDK